VELKINFLKPAQGDFLVGKGSLIQQSGTLSINKAEIYSADDDLVGIMIQTNKNLRPRSHT